MKSAGNSSVDLSLGVWRLIISPTGFPQRLDGHCLMRSSPSAALRQAKPCGDDCVGSSLRREESGGAQYVSGEVPMSTDKHLSILHLNTKRMKCEFPASHGNTFKLLALVAPSW